MLTGLFPGIALLCVVSKDRIDYSIAPQNCAGHRNDPGRRLRLTRLG
jgi:hypothetical protein